MYIIINQSLHCIGVLLWGSFFILDWILLIDSTRPSDHPIRKNRGSFDPQELCINASASPKCRNVPNVLNQWPAAECI